VLPDGLAAGAVGRDDEHGRRPFEGAGQAGRIGEVARPDPYAALLKGGQLLRVAHTRAELLGRYALQQRVEHAPAELTACPGNDDHDFFFPNRGRKYR
jgi:hypothetical protein